MIENVSSAFKAGVVQEKVGLNFAYESYCINFLSSFIHQVVTLFFRNTQ